MEKEGIASVVREIDPGELAAALEAEAAAGTAVVGVAGGDGTLSTAATTLAGSGTVLAPFALGTLNHFARRLALDDADATARALRAGRTTRVPLGVAGERRFVNNASCGFYPHVVRHRERIRPVLGKWPAAAIASVQVLLGFPRMRLRLDTPEATLDRRVPGVWIGLGRGSFRLPGEDRLKEDASVLEIVIPHAASRTGMLGLAARVLWRLARRRAPRADGLEIRHAPAVTLEARRSIDVALDGEPFRLPTPLEMRIEPGALEVVMGEDAGD